MAKTIKGLKLRKKKVQGAPHWSEAGTIAGMQKVLDNAKTARAWSLFRHDQRARENAQNMSAELARLSSQHSQLSPPNQYMRQYMDTRAKQLASLQQTIRDRTSNWQNM